MTPSTLVVAGLLTKLATAGTVSVVIVSATSWFSNFKFSMKKKEAGQRDAITDRVESLREKANSRG